MGFEQIKVELQDWMGTDVDVASTAWTSSYGAESVKKKAHMENEVARVITQQLIPLGHKSPIEQIEFRFWLRMPIFCERQFDKYRLSLQFQDAEIEYNVGTMGRWSISQNEESGRYRKLNAESYDLPQDVRAIANQIAHNAGVNFIHNDSYADYKSGYDRVIKKTREFYDMWLDAAKQQMQEGLITNDEYKRFREVHRGVLGTQQFTTVVAKMNLACLTHFWTQRLSKSAQPEIQDLAQKMFVAVCMANNVPITMVALSEKYRWGLDPEELVDLNEYPEVTVLKRYRRDRTDIAFIGRIKNMLGF